MTHIAISPGPVNEEMNPSRRSGSLCTGALQVFVGFAFLKRGVEGMLGHANIVTAESFCGIKNQKFISGVVMDLRLDFFP
jgi:hypothetical protein